LYRKKSLTWMEIQLSEATKS